MWNTRAYGAKDVSETLEKGRKSGRSFVYCLKTGELEEKDGDLSSTAWKKARHEEGERLDAADARRFVYWIDTATMCQTNEYHGCPRRLRSIRVEQDELERTNRWP